jgi:hypothetical protein
MSMINYRAPSELFAAAQGRQDQSRRGELTNRPIRLTATPARATGVAFVRLWKRVG